MLFVSLLLPIGKGKEAIAYLKKLKAPKGITIRNVCVTMSSYDGVIIFEAPDTKTALNFAVAEKGIKCRNHHHYRVF